jgi:MoaA/NifB/PqqE/SkfB family radical SAM enzyme
MNTTSEKKRIPEIIGWEITNRCNLSCAHCFTAATERAHDEMDTAECRTVIDSMAKIGVGLIGWTGGEPMLRDDLEELTAYAWSKGIKSNITTNGILFDPVRAERLIRAGIRAVQISLDGSDAERNRNIRGASKEEFDIIIEAIRTSKRLGTRVVIASLLGQENLHDAPEMIKLAKREGVDGIRFCG